MGDENMETTTTYTHKLTIGYDSDAERPDGEGSSFTMLSFNSRHTNFVHPDDVDDTEILATLSYYEHGRCRWMVGDSTVPDYGGFDTVDIAGVIVKAEEWDQEWWDGLDADHRRMILDSVAAEYTSFVNGDVYWFSLETIETCPTCHNHSTGEFVESMSGFIGDIDVPYGMGAEIQALLQAEGIDPNGVKIVGDAAYLLDNVDLSNETAVHVL